MKKYAILLIISLFGLLASKTIYVKPDGSNLNGGTNWDDAYQWISVAIENAADDDTIMLRGTFTLTEDEGVDRSVRHNGLQISKNLTIVGEDRETTIIQAAEAHNLSSTRLFFIGSNKTVEKENDFITKLPITVIFENITMRYGNTQTGGCIFAYSIENLELNNCLITENKSIHLYSDISNWWFGGGAISALSNNLTVTNSVILDNSNHVQSADTGGGGIFYYPQNLSFSKPVIRNTVLKNNHSIGVGGGMFIPNNANSGKEIVFENCTISKNLAGKGGHALSVYFYGNLSLVINSCTISENHPTTMWPEHTQSILFGQMAGGEIINTKNSIFANYKDDIDHGQGGYVTNWNFSYSTAYVSSLSRSYTLCDDYTLPIPDGSIGNYNSIAKEEIIKTEINHEEGTYYYKIIAGSPAKDAIPKGTDPNNPFNGAGNYITDDEGNPILDEYGNIQVLDQRGFNVWNQKKDIGAYESPYYWVDVANEDQYATIPSWRTKLMIADPIEGWTDYMRAQTGGKIILSDNSEIIREEGSELHWYGGSYMDVAGSSRIRYGSYFIENANVNIYDGAQLSLLNSNTAVPASASLNIGNDSRLILEGESTVILGNGLNVTAKDNAELLVYGPAKLVADGVSFSYTGTESEAWKGINGQIGSKIDLNNVNIVGALTGVSADTPQMFEITKSTFEGCTNGIDLFGIQANSAYLITDNTLVGNDEGRGVIITGASTDGVFSRNKISHFNTGASFIMSSPAVSKCEFSYNKYYGILSSGREALPHLINTEQIQLQGELNCLLEKNAYASNTSLFPSAHIGIIPVGNIYMRNNDIISSPNFPGISIAQAAFRDPTHILLDAQYNYWGAEQVTDDYFFGHSDYTIDYEHYYSAPCGTGTDPSLAQYATTESRMLTSALSLESDGKIIAAIKLYELIIKKYVDTPEYYVAMARLPYLYEQAGLDNNELIATYDEAIDSEDVSHKKFFKGKKVATHIKGKRYDEAIAVAEEMKAEAEIEEEIILADINIAIANMLKENEGKGKNGTQIKDPRELISRLYGDEEKNNPSDITESVLPTQHELFQNYPNPFNPVTQIKFALAKTADVKLSVYNISGQKVAELANGSKQAGVHTVDFDGSRLNSGVYYYTLEVDGKNLTKKMVLTK